MVEWIDWWYQSEAFGRTVAGTLILATVLGGLGTWVTDEAATEAGSIVGLWMAIVAAVSAVLCSLSICGPIALRTVIWVVTGA